MRKLNSIIIVLLLAQLSLQAQGHWELEFQLRGDEAKLTNHSTYNPSNPPVIATNKSTPTLGGGIGAGYYKNRKFGFEGFSFGLNYSRYHVDYTSTIHVPGRIDVHGTAFSNLNYLNLPLTARLAIGKLAKFQFFIDGGLYGAALIDYKENARIQDAYDVTYHNDYYVEGGGKIKLDHGLYKKWDWGALGAFGAKYTYNKNLAFSAKLQIAKSFVDDIEDKRAMKSKNGVGLGTYIFWDAFVYKGLAGVPTGIAGERGATQLLSYGIQISCNINL
ncbi:MAG: outer membrane beta-barrel protein [Chitinophagaceae bacterium]